MTASAARPAAIDELTGRLLNELQDRFPLEERPYAVVGERLGIDEAEVLARLRAARAQGVVRQICAIYDTAALGYTSSLVAMRVAAERLASAAAVVNAHPGVSHNYLRSHEFNLWFTVAMPPGHTIEPVIARLHELAGAESTRALPTLRLFKIGVTLDMTGERPAGERGAPEYGEARRELARGHTLDADDIAFVRATQGDFGDVARPFDAPAAALGTTTAAVLARAERLQARGQLRRVAAILNHRVAGFRANGMAVWAVPAERTREFGEFVAGYRNVSHCYERPTYEDWPYRVFSMIHAAHASGVEAVVQEIAAASGVEERRVLYSSTEFKKIRLPYFTPELRRVGSTLHAGRAGARVSDASGTAPEASGREALARGQQFVKFSGYRLGATLRGGSAEARRAAGRCLVKLLDASAERMLTRVYSTVGVRADTDFVVWQVAEELEAIRGWHTQLLASPLAGAIERSQSFLSMTMRSLYGNPLHPRAEGDAGRARLWAEERGSAYLFVYPMVKTRAWYALPRAEQQRMMDEPSPSGTATTRCASTPRTRTGGTIRSSSWRSRRTTRDCFSRWCASCGNRKHRRTRSVTRRC